MSDQENAQALIERFGIQPFMLADGTLGVHFMQLSESVGGLFAESLIKQISDDIDSHRAGDNGKLEGVTACMQLYQWRGTLLGALGLIDAALREIEPH